MKLLTTIAAVLISISAYSQDLIEYDKGTFTQNGEQLSMEQIDDFTKLSKVGRRNFLRANRFISLHKNRNHRSTNNIASLVVGIATGFAGGVGVYIGAILYEYPVTAILFAGPGAGLSAVSYNAFSSIVSEEMCLPRRDKQFNKVADKINQAISAGGPSAQSSNQ